MAHAGRKHFPSLFVGISRKSGTPRRQAWKPHSRWPMTPQAEFRSPRIREHPNRGLETDEPCFGRRSGGGSGGRDPMSRGDRIRANHVAKRPRVAASTGNSARRILAMSARLRARRPMRTGIRRFRGEQGGRFRFWRRSRRTSGLAGAPRRAEVEERDVFQPRIAACRGSRRSKSSFGAVFGLGGAAGSRWPGPQPGREAYSAAGCDSWPPYESGSGHEMQSRKEGPASDSGA